VDYKVEELATATGVKVDTVRFYQGRGLIPPPERQGRTAVYHDRHLLRIRQIRSLLGQGFSLAQIARLPEPGENASEAKSISVSEAHLLAALAEERGGERALTRAELVAESGVPDELITAALAAGLLEPGLKEGEESYANSDVEMLRSGLALIGAGIPLGEMLELGRTHARQVQELCDAGIDLFDDHIRKASQSDTNPEVVGLAFQQLLPEVTRLVALHFQRTLVNRAIDRLRDKGEGPALELALDAVATAVERQDWRK